MTTVTTIPVSMLQVGDILATDDNYQHVVDDIRDIGSGCTRVWVDVLDDGKVRCRYDKLFGCWEPDESVEVER